MRLTPNQSHYVLGTLIARRKIRQSQVEAVLKGREKEIAMLRDRLTELEELGSGSSRAASPRRRGRRRGAGGRRRPRMTSKLRALRRLQGKYMGYVRRLRPAEKARVRAVREKQGMEASVRLASSLAARSS